MRTIRLPFDPEGAFIFLEDAETYLPMLCPACNQGFLAEEFVGGEWLYTCWSPVHPAYACHTQWVVEAGPPYGSWEKSVARLTLLGVLPLW